MIPRWKRASIKRQRNALRDSTWRNYLGAFRLSFSFCIRFGFNPLKCDQDTINLFTEMLIEGGQSSRNISNMLTGIKTIFIWTGINLSPINDVQWRRNIKSLDRTLRTQPTLPSSFSINHLIQLVRFFGNKVQWIGLKVFVFLAYFGLLRLSNLVPKTFKDIDKTRNTLLKDVIRTKFGLAIRLRWGKTQQGNNQWNIVPIPRIRKSILCPCKAFLTYRSYFQTFCRNGHNILLSNNGKT